MDETKSMRRRRSRITTLLCCFCCFGSDSMADRLLLKPSGFHKVTRSNSGPEVSAMDEHPQKWWLKGWNSLRRAGEWSESVIEDHALGGCCRGAKWKRVIKRCKADGKTIYNSKPARFHYDQVSYQLNFDDGHSQYKGMFEKMNFPASPKHLREVGTIATL